MDMMDVRKSQSELLDLRLLGPSTGDSDHYVSHDRFLAISRSSIVTGVVPRCHQPRMHGSLYGFAMCQNITSVHSATPFFAVTQLLGQQPLLQPCALDGR